MLMLEKLIKILGNLKRKIVLVEIRRESCLSMNLYKTSG